MFQLDGQVPDITTNIKNIEKLKARLLTDVSEVFEIMASGRGSELNIDEKLAQIIISSYVLAKKIGYEYSEIDSNILSKLKLIILSLDMPQYEYNELSDWIRLKQQ